MPQQRRQKPLTGPIAIAVSVQLIFAVFAIWAFNAARAVSQFSRSIGASGTADSGVTHDDFYHLQVGVSYQQVVQTLGSEGQPMSQNQFDLSRFAGVELF